MTIQSGDGSRRRSSWPAAFAVFCIAGALLTAFVIERCTSWPMRAAATGVDQLERVGRDLRAAFMDLGHLQPRVTINDRVYAEQTTPTAELVVFTRRTEVEHEMQHSWAGSTKRVKLHGTFNVRVGFDLRQELKVSVLPDAIVVELPHAQILGIDQENVDVVEFDNGLWNHISAEDLQSELAALPQLAREKVATSDLIAEAEGTLTQQLVSRIHAAQPVRVVFTAQVPSG